MKYLGRKWNSKKLVNKAVKPKPPEIKPDLENVGKRIVRFVEVGNGWSYSFNLKPGEAYRKQSKDSVLSVDML